MATYVPMKNVNFEGYCSENDCKATLPVKTPRMWHLFSKRIVCMACGERKNGKSSSIKSIDQLAQIEKKIDALLAHFDIELEDDEQSDFTPPVKKEREPEKPKKSIFVHQDNNRRALGPRQLMEVLDHEYHQKAQFDHKAQPHYFVDCTPEFVTNVLQNWGTERYNK